MLISSPQVVYTGVTKFSKISIFSDLTQPNDISQSKVYAEICGISEKEMIDNFEPDIRELAEETFGNFQFLLYICALNINIKIEK
jgi:hypothetical protein